MKRSIILLTMVVSICSCNNNSKTNSETTSDSTKMAGDTMTKAKNANTDTTKKTDVDCTAFFTSLSALKEIASATAHGMINNFKTTNTTRHMFYAEFDEGALGRIVAETTCPPINIRFWMARYGDHDTCHALDPSGNTIDTAASHDVILLQIKTPSGDKYYEPNTIDYKVIVQFHTKPINSPLLPTEKGYYADLGTGAPLGKMRGMLERYGNGSLNTITSGGAAEFENMQSGSTWFTNNPGKTLAFYIGAFQPITPGAHPVGNPTYTCICPGPPAQVAVDNYPVIIEEESQLVQRTKKIFKLKAKTSFEILRYNTPIKLCPPPPGSPNCTP